MVLSILFFSLLVDYVLIFCYFGILSFENFLLIYYVLEKFILVHIVLRILFLLKKH